MILRLFLTVLTIELDTNGLTVSSLMRHQKHQSGFVQEQKRVMLQEKKAVPLQLPALCAKACKFDFAGANCTNAGPELAWERWADE